MRKVLQSALQGTTICLVNSGTLRDLEGKTVKRFKFVCSCRQKQTITRRGNMRQLGRLSRGDLVILRPCAHCGLSATFAGRKLLIFHNQKAAFETCGNCKMPIAFSSEDMRAWRTIGYRQPWCRCNSSPMLIIDRLIGSFFLRLHPIRRPSALL